MSLMSEVGSKVGPRPNPRDVWIASDKRTTARHLGWSQTARKRHMHRTKTATLFDDLVGAGEQRGRNFEAERLGGLLNHSQPCSGSDEIHGVETLAKKSINLPEL
jgi:hypothetical protein